MESLTIKQKSEKERQADIRKQIALLQAELGDSSEAPATDVPGSPNRKRPSSNVLVPETPSKKKKVAPRDTGSKRTPLPPPITQQRASATPKAAPAAFKNTSTPTSQSSTVLQKLAQAHNRKGLTPAQETTVRSNSFSAAPPPIAPPEGGSAEAGTAARDDNLALIEELTLGPVEHKPPFDDPHFEKLEPNSGTRLSSRVLPHDDFQDHLRGRYYLSPSKLYSVVRLLPNKQGYDVPVEGDWLTIAVIAERGLMKYTQAPVGLFREDKPPQESDEMRMDELPALDVPAASTSAPRPFQKRQKPPGDTKPSGKKYVNLKLIDFGCRSRGSSADGRKAKIRGDAFLSLLLFESDTYDIITKEDGTKRKLYRGGSRGAFERMSKLREGAVVALLNPKILKPFQRSTDKPHPTENILAITPESDESIAVIGYAQDLGMCKAMKRDGTRCKSWCDKRVSDVCDFHIQTAVQRTRAARPEFASGTNGMSTSAKKKPAYDPARQWGLKPEADSSGTTYVVSGHVVSGSGSDPRTMYVGENLGREAQAKAARKLAADADKTLQHLLSRDKQGTKALMSAREFAKRQAEAVKDEGKTRGKGKGKQKAGTQAKEAAPEKDAPPGEDGTPRKNAYSAELIKQLGFDPTGRDGRPTRDATVRSKLDTLASVQATRKIELGPRPGKKSSCVQKPDGAKDQPSVISEDGIQCTDIPDASDSDSDDDKLEYLEVATFGRPVGLLEKDTMVDLDDSDND